MARINVQLLSDLRTIVREALDEFQPTLVHLHNAHHFAPEPAEACFAETGARPMVHTVHDRVGEQLYPNVFQLPWSHTFFVSHYLRSALPLPRGESTTLWLGIDHQVFTLSGGQDPRLASLERPIIFHPARLLRWKGVEVGLAAFIKLRRELGRGTLVLCASENIVDYPSSIAELRAELAARARDAGVEPFVRFLDFTRDQIPAAYRAADLIWNPTLDEEPFGLVPLEAMACNVPVIVTASGGMVETVEDGVNGRIVPKGDADALAAAAREVLTADGQSRRLREGGLIRVKNFNISQYVKSLAVVYRELSTSSMSAHGGHRGD